MLDYPVLYQGVDLNTVTPVGDGKRRGCLLEEVNFGDVAGVGYTEKRAQGDGLDASDVYLGSRIIRLQGTVYGENPGDLHDRLQTIRTIFTPTVAYVGDIPNYGYLPLQFTLPTQVVDDWPAGTRDMEFRARPRQQPSFSLRRDTGSGSGADAGRGQAVMWQALLECKDPRMYVRPETWLYWNVAGVKTLVNRGNYPAPLSILLDIPASSPAGSVEVDVGSSQLTLTIPDAAVQQTMRYSGDLKVLTLESNSVEVLRMDLLAFRNNTTHPTVPPAGGSATIRLNGGVTLTGTATTGTRFMYGESFA